MMHRLYDGFPYYNNQSNQGHPFHRMTKVHRGNVQDTVLFGTPSVQGLLTKSEYGVHVDLYKERHNEQNLDRFGAEGKGER